MYKLNEIMINTQHEHLATNNRGVGDQTTPFVYSHMVPGTDNNFLLEFHES